MSDMNENNLSNGQPQDTGAQPPTPETPQDMDPRLEQPTEALPQEPELSQEAESNPDQPTEALPQEPEPSQEAEPISDQPTEAFAEGPAPVQEPSPPPAASQPESPVWEQAGSQPPPDQPYGQPPYQGQPEQGQMPPSPYQENYGAIPPQQPYGEQPGYGPGPQQPFPGPPGGYDPYYQPAPPPKKKSKAIPILIGSIVALIAVIGISAVFFAAPIMRAVMPEQYFSMALSNTALNFTQSTSHLPDFRKFSGSPIGQEFHLSYEDSDPYSYYGSSTEFSLSAVTKSSMESKRIWMDASINIDGAHFRNNEFYISENLVAFRLPAVYDKHQYLTIDPETFARDWNRSPLGEDMPVSPSFDLEEVIESFFSLGDEASVEDSDVELLRLANNVRKSTERFLSQGMYTNHGAVTTELGGQRVKLTKMSYTFSSLDMENTFGDYVQVLRDYYIGYYLEPQQEAYGAFYEYYLEMYDEMFDAMMATRFPNGLTVDFYIGSNHTINKIEVERFSFGVYDSYFEEYEDFRMGLNVELLGGKKLLEQATATLDFYDGYGDKYSLRLTKSGETMGKEVIDRVRLILLENNKEEMSFFYTFKWDQSLTDSRNMSMELGFEEYGYSWNSSASILLTGILEEEKDKISFTRGNLSLLGDYTDYTFDLDYSIYKIRESDLDIDLTDAINFFNIDLEDFLDETERAFESI